MSDDFRQFEARKKDHIALALMDANQAEDCNALDAVQLVHEALPDLDFATIALHSKRLGQPVEKPFIVASMTAGHPDAGDINQHLLAACAETGWAMGVGSQRRELTDHSAGLTWPTLRAEYPHVSLYANLGIAQVITASMPSLLRLVEGFDALIIHCNALQECIQPEGTPAFKGCWDALARVVHEVPLPVVVKETGCGFSTATLARLNAVGVAAVEVSGLGGTHWGRIEGLRAPEQSMRRRAAATFRAWGHTTPDCVRRAQQLSPQFEIWGSGGVRHGLDAAKLFALGASNVAFAKPLLAAAMQSVDAVVAVMNTIEYEVRIALFCTGSATLCELQEKIQC